MGTAADAAVVAGYDPEPSGEVARVARDVALLRMERPIRDRRIAPYDLGDPPRDGDRVSVVSYAADRLDAPSLEESCGVLRAYDGIAETDCRSAPGASGSPVIAMVRGRPTIVSIISGQGIGPDGPVTVMADVGANVGALVAALEARHALFGRQGARGSGGAKFLRPRRPPPRPRDGAPPRRRRFAGGLLNRGDGVPRSSPRRVPQGPVADPRGPAHEGGRHSSLVKG